jgi:hypothetical protein
MVRARGSIKGENLRQCSKCSIRKKKKKKDYKNLEDECIKSIKVAM